MQNYLLTNRLWLRPFCAEDAPQFYDICSNPNVMRYIGDGAVPTLEEIKQSIHRWITHYHEYGYSLLALLNKETKELMGFCGLIHQEINGQIKIELGYRLGEAYWGSGFATEAASCIKAHAFNQHKISELISIIQVKNNASINVAKKMGMQLMQECIYHNQDVFIYYMVRYDRALLFATHE